jgi:hypothetical protein
MAGEARVRRSLADREFKRQRARKGEDGIQASPPRRDTPPVVVRLTSRTQSWLRVLATAHPFVRIGTSGSA